MKQDLSARKQNLAAKLPCLETEADSRITGFKNAEGLNTLDQVSNILFLNDFQSSVLSENIRKRILQPDVKSKYTPCAVPLAPPNRLREPFIQEKLLQHKEKATNIQNNAVYHIISDECETKKLSVQVLPSISIVGQNKNPNRSSFSQNCSLVNFQSHNALNDIKQQVTSAHHNSVRTTFLPVPAEKSSSFPNLGIFSNFPLTNKMDQLVGGENSQKSTFTQTSSKVEDISEVHIDESKLKEIVKEILKDFQDVSQSHRQLNASQNKKFTVEKESNERLAEKLPNLDAPVDILQSGKIGRSILPPQNFSTQSTFTQTDYDFLGTRMIRGIVKDIVDEVTQELKSLSEPEHLAFNVHHSTCTSAAEMVNREIQTDVNYQITSLVGTHYSKGTQVSSMQENAKEVSPLCQSNVLNESTEKKSQSFAQKYLADSHRECCATSAELESIVKCIYEYICEQKKSTTLNQNMALNQSVTTRDVAVQFNPLLTATKSTVTTEIRRINNASQCDSPSRLSNVNISVTDASTQMVPQTVESKTMLLASQKVDASTCYERQVPTFIDSSNQTVESIGLLPNSENSATNTSVSTTPVSDSIFLDDMLSEGEVFLPWNLRLLSDKHGCQNSNTIDQSDVSSKDYSLSEGEIHPKYIQQFYSERPFSTNSRNEEERPDLIPTKLPQCAHCRSNLPLSNSSWSEGEVRKSDMSLSSGEIRPNSNARFPLEVHSAKSLSPALFKPGVSCNLPSAESSQKDGLKSPSTSSDEIAKYLLSPDMSENDARNFKENAAVFPSTSHAALNTVVEETATSSGS